MQVHLELQGVVGFPVDEGAQAGAVRIAQRLPVRPMLPGATLFGFTRDADLHRVGDRAGQVAVDLGRAEAAGLHLQPAMVIRGRLVQHEVDGTACGVAAVKRALRTAQHLDTLDVKDQAVRLERHWEADFVDVDADRGRVVARIILEADAANGELQLAAAELRRDLQRGRLVLKVEDVVDVARLQLRAGDHADRTAKALHALHATLRGDRDVLLSALRWRSVHWCRNGGCGDGLRLR